MRRRFLRSGVLAVITAGSVGGALLPASAHPADPPPQPQPQQRAYAYGAMVEYDLTFPVPDVTWYEDWFWAPRANGEHHGQDLFAPKGTPVLAVATGVVTRANSSSVSATERPDRCCSLAIQHDDGWTSLYIHLDNDTPGTDDGQGWGLAEGIDIGTRVEAGQLIGYVGDSGNAEDTMPHVHFELKDPSGVAVNPYDALLVAQGRPVCRVADPGPLDALVASTGLIREGDRGTAVRQLQALAVAFGHDPGPVDGIFGPLTKKAVRRLQRDLGLGVDGIVGDETRGAVRRVAAALAFAPALDPDARLMAFGAVGSDVGFLQELLALAGFDPGGADGMFGPQTRTAVTDFQTAVGIHADGVVGRETWSALGEHLGVSGLITCSGG